MEKWKEICRKLLFPPLWLLLLLTGISTAALVIVFVKGLDTWPGAYAIYVLCFYTLTVICLACYETIPAYYRKAKGKVHANEHAHRYLTDTEFKTHVNLYLSLGINLLYVAVNVASAILYRTWWFAIFAIYYITMALMRFLLVRYAGHGRLSESGSKAWERSRLCAYILLTVNLALSGAVLMMISFDRGFEYRGILIYVVAMYTFYITTTAIRDMVKFRKSTSPIIITSKMIKLAAALMSMLSLETAMLSQFGADTSPSMRRIMITATGGGISLIIVVMAIDMIVRATREMRMQKKRSSHKYE